MHLLLTLTGGRLPPADRRRTLSAGTLTIGRGPDNDWVLPDAERIVSKNHGTITAENGRFILTDTSSNGIYLNGSRQATARDSRIVLSDGDQVRIGDYVIDVSEVEDAPSVLPRRNRPSDAPDPLAADPLAIDPLDDPLGRPDPAFRHPIPQASQSARATDPFDERPSRPERRIDQGEDLFRGVAPDRRWHGLPRPDHAPAPSQAVPPPRFTAPPPEDIDFDALIGDLTPQSRPASPPPPRTEPETPTARVAPEPSAAPRQPAPPPTPTGTDARATLAAFLEGAGMSSHRIDDRDPEAAMRAAGAIFRAMADGIREILLSRAAIKGEMRITQTMIRARGNNGLKFSATPEDAVAALLTPDRAGYMNPLAATREAFSDIKSHELAMVAGMQSALLALLRRFDPVTLEERLTAGPLDAVLPHARKARYWDAFKQTYGEISREAEDDFQSVFGRSFAEAYKRLAERDRNRD